MAFRIALLQLTSTNDPDGGIPENRVFVEYAQYIQLNNLNKARMYCEIAADEGADLAMLPEFWNMGDQIYDPSIPGAKEKWISLGITRQSFFFKEVQSLAKRLKIAIAIPYIEAYKKGVRDCVSLIDRNGKVLFTYAKIHTADFTIIEANCTPGNNFYVSELITKNDKIKIGAMICYDREFPESARILMLMGAEIIIVPNACTIDDRRIIQLRTRAFENSVGIAMVNYGKPQHNGNSLAIDVDSSVIVHAPEEEGIFFADFDLEKIRKYRKITIWGGAFRRPHKYQKLIEKDVQELFKRKNAYGELFNS